MAQSRRNRGHPVYRGVKNVTKKSANVVRKGFTNLFGLLNTGVKKTVSGIKSFSKMRRTRRRSRRMSRKAKK